MSDYYLHTPLSATRSSVDDNAWKENTLQNVCLTPISPSTNETHIKKNNLYTAELSVKGMTCASCTSAVESLLNALPGVSSVAVALVTESARVVYDSSQINTQQLINTVEDGGFDCRLISTNETPPTSSNSLNSTSNNYSITSNSYYDTSESDIESLIFNIIPPSLSSKNNSHTNTPNQNNDSQLESINVAIYGMTCASCSSAIESTVKKLNGIKSITVALATENAKIVYEKNSIGPRDIVETIQDCGFDALLVDQMESNAQLDSLSKIKETKEYWTTFKISLLFVIPQILLSHMVLHYFPTIKAKIQVSIIPGLFLDQFLAFLLALPIIFYVSRRYYTASYKALKHKSATMDVLVTTSISAAFLFSIFSMIVSMCASKHTRPVTDFETCGMIVAFVTLGKCLESSAKGKTSAALSRLMQLAPSSATIYSNQSDIESAKQTAASALTLLKKQNLNQTISNSSENLISEIPPMSNAAEKIVSTDLVQRGDIVILLTGCRAPADGIVISGSTVMNESHITGEDRLVSKYVGNTIIGGAVNEGSRVDFIVTRAGKDTQLAQIVRLVKEAQMLRPHIQQYVDRIAGRFVPLVLFFSLVTFLSWVFITNVIGYVPSIFKSANDLGRSYSMMSLQLAISVIVVACPCALGLATPTAVMVGTGVGAENGILFKGGNVLESASKVASVVFDKTGTLTLGKMCVTYALPFFPPLFKNALVHSDTDVKKSPAFDYLNDLWWHLLTSVEKYSEHPIGRSIVKQATRYLRQPISYLEDCPPIENVDNVSVVVGRGIEATVTLTQKYLNELVLHEPSVKSQFRVAVGNLAFMTDNLKINGDTILRTAEESSIDSEGNRISQKMLFGMTPVYVAIDGNFAGRIFLTDKVRSDARATVTALQKLGITVKMITGDSADSAARVASLVGILPMDTHSGADPSRKLEIIRSLQENEAEVSGNQTKRKFIAFVGDGVNDSPALAAADIGIAVASGTDVAIESADIILMNSSSTSAATGLSNFLISRSNTNTNNNSDDVTDVDEDAGDHVLLRVPNSIILSKKIFNRIRLNLLWATCYNFIMIPFAMGLLLPFDIILTPMMASAAMALSSFSVVTSSLLLKQWKKPVYDINISNSKKDNISKKRGNFIKNLFKIFPRIGKKFVGLFNRIFRNTSYKEDYSSIPMSSPHDAMTNNYDSYDFEIGDE